MNWNCPQQAVNGQTVQAHLYGLKLQAFQEDILVPEIFTDTSFAKAFDYRLSTGQVSVYCQSKNIALNENLNFFFFNQIIWEMTKLKLHTTQIYIPAVPNPLAAVRGSFGIGPQRKNK